MYYIHIISIKSKTFVVLIYEYNSCECERVCMWLQTNWPWIIFDGWHFCAFALIEITFCIEAFELSFKIVLVVIFHIVVRNVCLSDIYLSITFTLRSIFWRKKRSHSLSLTRALPFHLNSVCKFLLLVLLILPFWGERPLNLFIGFIKSSQFNEKFLFFALHKIDFKQFN